MSLESLYQNAYVPRDLHATVAEIGRLDGIESLQTIEAEFEHPSSHRVLSLGSWVERGPAPSPLKADRPWRP